MEQLTQFFQQILDLNFTRDQVFLGMIMISAILLVLTVGVILMGINSPLKRRISAIVGSEEQLSALPQRNSKLDDTLESIAPLISPKSQKERESIRFKLMHAGFHQNNALAIFYSLKIVSAMFGIVGALLCYLFLQDFSQQRLVLLGSLFIGLFAPNIVLEKLLKDRQWKIKSGVADALDLLVVCTESGLGFNAALRRVADELTVSHPELADELDTVCVKIKAGVTMPDALNELVIRTGIVELSGLVSMLSHASRIGGSLAQTLRDYTEDYRDKRQQEAEEIAAKIPTKMIFPMMLCIWPCFFIVALGPAIITLGEAFK